MEILKFKFRWLSSLLFCLYQCLLEVPFQKFPGRDSRGPQHQLMTTVDVTPYLFDSLATLWLGYVGRIMKAALFAHLLPSRGWHEYKEPGELEPEKQGEVLLQVAAVMMLRGNPYPAERRTNIIMSQQCQGKGTNCEDAPWGLRLRHKN